MSLSRSTRLSSPTGVAGRSLSISSSPTASALAIYRTASGCVHSVPHHDVQAEQRSACEQVPHSPQVQLKVAKRLPIGEGAELIAVGRHIVDPIVERTHIVAHRKLFDMCQAK